MRECSLYESAKAERKEWIKANKGNQCDSCSR